MSRTRLILFLVANAVSIAGTRVSAVAIPWLVLVTTGSAAKTGITAMVELAPLVVAKGLAGPVIDRVGARRVSVLADCASAVLVACVPLLHALHALTFANLLVVVGLAGAARGPGDTAKETLAPSVADATGLPMERVAGLTSTVDRSASIVAPGLAGLLIAAVGAASALAVDAASFAVCALAVTCLVPRALHQPVEADGERYTDQLRAGLRFLRQDRLLRGLVMMICATNLLDTAYSSVLLPTWIHSHGYGPQQLGLIGSAFGLSATVGSVLAAAYAHRLPRRRTYAIGFILCGAPRFVALALGVPVSLIIGVALVGGFGAGFLNPILSAVFVGRIPRHMLGRVNALADALAWAGMPLGGLLAGVLVTAVGLVPVLVVAGAAYATATIAPTRSPHWSEMDERRPAQMLVTTG